MLTHVEQLAESVATDIPEAGRAHLLDVYIEGDPQELGPGEARTRDEGVPVWAIISYLEAAEGDIEQVARDYDLHPDAVRAAILYYRKHSQAISVRIVENELLTAS